jgi:hypothetical protein
LHAQFVDDLLRGDALFARLELDVEAPGIARRVRAA